MQITETEIGPDNVRLVIEGDFDINRAFDSGPKITIQMPVVGDERSSLAFHHLATLKQARDVIGDQIQRLSRIVDQDS